MPNTKISESLALVGQQNGVVIIPAGTPLTRLNYFDGKFLRASDLKAEQEYLRQLVRQSNQAGGPGVAYGYDVTLGDGDTIDIGPGLAIDAQGRALLPKETSINIQELIDKSPGAAEPLLRESGSGRRRFRAVPDLQRHAGNQPAGGERPLRHHHFAGGSALRRRGRLRQSL